MSVGKMLVHGKNKLGLEKIWVGNKENEGYHFQQIKTEKNE